MKKHFLIFVATILAVSLLAGCGGTAEQPSGAAQSSKASSQASSSVSSQRSSQQAASSQQQSASEPSTPKESSSGTATDGMSGKLADAYIGMFSGGKYYMKYRSSQEFEGEKMETVAEMAVDGDDTAMMYEMEGMSMHVVAKDNKSYIINHEEKTVMVMSVGSAQENSTNVFGNLDFVFKGSGTGELFGASLPYEEYETDSGDARFFFDGKKLAGFESSFEGMTVQMEIIEMSENIPAGMFDIPDGYEVTEY